MNGHVNGYANGHANGHVNGNANVHVNGNANGHVNGNANGHVNGNVSGVVATLNVESKIFQEIAQSITSDQAEVSSAPCMFLLIKITPHFIA
jgi:hypothetical protein